jgi:hypothetical protein
MTPPHLLNVAIHVGAGALGILIGLLMLAQAKGTPRHVRLGRVFVGCALVVGLSAIVGSAFFRFVPLFAVLSVLIPYVLLSGWHVIYTKTRGPDWVDALLLAAAVVAAKLLVPVLLGAQQGASTSGTVVKSTLGALFVVLAYDTARWTFPRRWHAVLWRYEHIYKILSALFGMMSAAVGNLLGGVPVAQLAPSVLGGLAIAWFFWREARRPAA